MAILPRNSSLCFTFELFNLQLEQALLGNYNLYVRKERLKETFIVAVRTEREKATRKVAIIIMCVDREENECSVITLRGLQGKFTFVKSRPHLHFQ